MATLTTNKTGKTAGYNIQWTEKGRRNTIYLGGRKYTKKTAERLNEVVETMLYMRRNGIAVPDKKTEQWIQNADERIQEKLAKFGFITFIKPRTCKELWDTFLQHKTDIKESSRVLYENCRSTFFATFSKTETLDKLTPDRLVEWKLSLLNQYAPATAAGRLKVAKIVLNWAVEQGWIANNPMQNIPIGSFINRAKDRTITMEEYGKLLDACPNQEWRVIIALARIGGLRCPSELKDLRWRDVNWEQDRFLVHASKTECHAGKEERIVPLFHELRAELDRYFLSDATERNEFVIQNWQGSRWVLHTGIQQIACNAGLGTLVRPFDNMRMSRSNEVLRRFGEVKESLWIGHSAKVMKNHYFSMSDTDFAEAVGRR